ncbi:hypothetical protein RHMOL_Rhmol04G0229800 [Rhododendron molle]|uniref:Uncharacterized protein n=1 Tax=Rhododendron molle TaxID=49168 RepID=A0ACC0P4K9_RHOML|nr:hypothetical protein RHMOL_Rhmol04G0229800 [Rhododendron molle]
MDLQIVPNHVGLHNPLNHMDLRKLPICLELHSLTICLKLHGLPTYIALRSLTRQRTWMYKQMNCFEVRDSCNGPLDQTSPQAHQGSSHASHDIEYSDRGNRT